MKMKLATASYKHIRSIIPDGRSSAVPEAIFFVLVFLVVTSTQTAPAGVFLTWPQAIRRAILSWSVWVLLWPLIIAVDRWLPGANGFVLQRFLFHVPLSFSFTLLKQFLVSQATLFLIGSGPEQAIDSVIASFKGTFQANFVTYWILVFVHITFDHQNRLRAREVTAAKLERLASQARLENLRAQLNPHFLFNALNTISAYIERGPQSSRKMLHEVKQLLLLSLEHSEMQEISLAQEISFVQHYLNIQKARFEERLTASLEIDSDVSNALVPTFILQPLVENAVVHGVARQLKHGNVQIQAWQTNEQLHLVVQDDGPGLPDNWNPDRTTGIGISNTRQRLILLYGARNQSFNIGSVSGGGVRVELTLPLRK